MVCLEEEGPVPVTVRDTINQSGENKKSIVHLTPTKTVDSIFREVAHQFLYNADEIELVLQSRDGTCHVLNEHRDKTVQEVGISCSPSSRHAIIISQLKSKTMTLYVPDVTEDDLLLGASASPTAGDMPNTATCSTCEPPPVFAPDYESYPGTSRIRPTVVESTNYVGLVNQAMTCYLNSLLQALYMTPEFRNALYNWEFDGVNETRSIPYQLQKLFLNLQTSSKSAVETTDLTTSFGWQGSDAWHQHDIQELCRVMFDALEQKFKDTKQANLINDLYEGKMLDYVKCLECGTEKSREDTFLDIPLPVRPFDSTVAYNSVEEALRAFVKPETLDGNNQYHCEKCNKKCDAHKGLKFTKFPYLLTLHLKRFDFDYSTMHRIKLNDKVVFPERLNLNSLVSVSKKAESLEDRESLVKCDDCSTTDSGSADDESCQGTDVSSTVNGQDDNCADSDEGIDVSSGNNHSENEAKGPYVYELFSIMIHSGSASGGHYYAYIKDFDKNLWFCFNDQSVTGITEDDIRKTYGGGPQRGYYSGAYSSSTNAYMLMYRQIDKDRNCRAITAEEFPPHIQKLLGQMRLKEEEDRINREKESDMIKIMVYCRNPGTGALQDVKISVYSDTKLRKAAECAYQRLKLDGVVPLEDCRLVMYNRKNDCINCSFESDELRFSEVLGKIDVMYYSWMLEIKEPGTQWKTYRSGGLNVRVFPVNLETEELDEPTMVRIDVNETVKELKEDLAKILQTEPSRLAIVMDGSSNERKLFVNDKQVINLDSNMGDRKLYVSVTESDDPEELVKTNCKLVKVMRKVCNVVCLNVVLPETDPGTLESLSIPSLDFNQNLDKTDFGDRGANSPSLRASPQPESGAGGDNFGDQSNSEDSSLSDSDRTLVGDTPGDCMALHSSSSDSPADQHMASPCDPCEDTYNYDVMGHPGGEAMHWDDEDGRSDHQRHFKATELKAHGDDEEREEERTPVNYYFKVTSVTGDGDCCERCCRVVADGRMTLERFKKHMESVLKVPSEYFKVFKRYSNSDDEWSCLTDTLHTAKDEEKLVLKLGRVLRKDEVNCKVYHLKPESLEASKVLFEHIIAKGQNVGTVKREILWQAKKQLMLDVPYARARLREKSWKKPRKVYLDDQKFGEDIITTTEFELYFQELPEPEPVSSLNQMAIFVRQWCPSTMTLKPFQEVVLETAQMDELKSKISHLSGVPLENVEVAHVKASFPCDMNLLDIQTELDWNPNYTQLDQWPLSVDSGSVFFYRDGREALKELTPEEKKELNHKENTRLGRLSIKSYSPGRERALKIYLDTSPSKSDDCVD